MSLTKGSLTLTRYQVEGELPPDPWPWLGERIADAPFMPIEGGTEEQSVGWCSAFDALDTASFPGGWASFSPFRLEPYLLLGLRVDQRRLPAAVLNKYHRMEIQKVRGEREGAKVSRMEREELREKVRLSLLARTPVTTRLYQVCWNTQTGELWLDTANNTGRAWLLDRFEHTFRLKLREVTPLILQRRVNGEEPPDHFGHDPGAMLGIGQPFLTWLWYVSEEQGAVDLPTGRIAILLGDRMILGPGSGQEGSQVMVKGPDLQLAEAREALRHGKRVDQIRLVLERDGEEFGFTLNSRDLLPAGLRLPRTASPGGDEGPEGAALERIALVEAAIRTINDLFRLHSQEAATDEYVRAMDAWIWEGVES